MKKKRCTNSSCRKVFKVDSLVCSHCGKQYPRESAVLDLRGKYTVVLTNAGIRKLHVIKVIRWHTGLGLKDAKTVADHVPSMIVTGYGASQVRELSAEIRAAGGDVMFIPASRGTKGVFVLPKKAG